jgi:hypothetical protein
MLVAFDRSRIRAPRAASLGRHGQSPLRASATPAQPMGRRGTGGELSTDPARRPRLRTIAGGKSEPPWRTS